MNLTGQQPRPGGFSDIKLAIYPSNNEKKNTNGLPGKSRPAAAG